MSATDIIIEALRETKPRTPMAEAIGAAEAILTRLRAAGIDVVEPPTTDQRALAQIVDAALMDHWRSEGGDVYWYGGPATYDPLWDTRLASALDAECYSCRPDVGWTKHVHLERTDEAAGSTVTIHWQCGHCGGTRTWDREGNELDDDGSL